MIVNSKTFIKENWKEHFRYYLSGVFLRKGYTEEFELPRFYLPVWQGTNRDALELWIVPLAPFIWVFYVLRDVFWLIWRDMLDLQRNLTRIRKMRSK